jgi:hypothetical protein
MKKLSVRAQKWLKTFHVLFAGIWVGAALSLTLKQFFISPALLSQSEHAHGLGQFSSGYNCFCLLSIHTKTLEEKKKSRLTVAY